MRTPARKALAALLLLGTGGTALGAQSIEVGVSALAVQSHVLFTNTRAEQTGQWFAVEGAVRLSKLRLGMASAMGSLAGATDALQPDRTGRSTSLTAHIQATQWAAIGAIAEAKRFDTDAGISVWRLIGGNVRLTPTIVPGALEGLADISVWPAATIIEGQTMGLALRTVVGATYALRGGLGVRLAYRFERFDFDDQGGSPRLEQYRGATLGAVFRLSR